LEAFICPLLCAKNEKKSCDKILKYFDFGPIFDPFTPILGKLDFFSKIWLRQFLEFMDSYFHAKNQKKLMNQF